MSKPDRREAHYAPGETAVLFVDMQKMFCAPGRDPAHPEMNAEHYYFRRLRDLVIPNQVRILEAARTHGVQVMHTIIEALTDKKSRTAQDLRHVLSEGGGALGASGVAMWAFERKAFLEYEDLDAARRDALIEHAMDLEVDDVEVKDMKEEGAADGAESVRVWAAASKLTSLRAALSGYTLINEQRCFVPTSAVELDAEAREAHDQVVESLLALDDVEEVWTNVAVSTS